MELFWIGWGQRDGRQLGGQPGGLAGRLAGWQTDADMKAWMFKDLGCDQRGPREKSYHFGY